MDNEDLNIYIGVTGPKIVFKPSFQDKFKTMKPNPAPVIDLRVLLFILMTE